MKTDPGIEGYAGGGQDMVAVWDPFVRLFHWSIVTSFVVAWLTAARWDDFHQWAGYAAGALVLLRLVWGIAGTKYARFTNFVYSPAIVAAYLRDMLINREARFLGHNPAGGAMIVVLLAVTAATAFTGWLENTDAYYGIQWVQDGHSYLAHAMLILVGVHVCGVALASFRHRENLVRAMITGLKRPH